MCLFLGRPGDPGCPGLASSWSSKARADLLHQEAANALQEEFAYDLNTIPSANHEQLHMGVAAR